MVLRWSSVKLAGVIALAVATDRLAVGSGTRERRPHAPRLRDAVVDGVLSPGEWDTAGHYDFPANRSPAEGGGTVPATLFVMNDATNLYLALRVSVTTLG